MTAALAAFERTIISYGCSYHRLEAVSDRDPGLVERTNQLGDAGKFRTPSLRNVEMTGPWWHDGTEPTLAGTLARHPDPAAAAEVPALIAFLHALTDQAFIADPRLARPDTACGRRL